MGPDVPEGTNSTQKILPHGLVSLDGVSALLTDPQVENTENSTQDLQMQTPTRPQELMDSDMKCVITSKPSPPSQRGQGRPWGCSSGQTDSGFI